MKPSLELTRPEILLAMASLFGILFGTLFGTFFRNLSWLHRFNITVTKNLGEKKERKKEFLFKTIVCTHHGARLEISNFTCASRMSSSESSSYLGGRVVFCLKPTGLESRLIVWAVVCSLLDMASWSFKFLSNSSNCAHTIVGAPRRRYAGNSHWLFWDVWAQTIQPNWSLREWVTNGCWHPHPWRAEVPHAYARNKIYQSLLPQKLSLQRKYKRWLDLCRFYFSHFVSVMLHHEVG